MIKEKLAFINQINEKNIIESLIEEKIIIVRCPNCGSFHIIRNGHYVRKVAHINEPSSHLKIQKYLCKNCRTSFKQLPHFLSSYSHYSNISLLKILIKEQSIKSISQEYDVSRTTVRNIKNRFQDVLKKLSVAVRKYSFETFMDLYFVYSQEFDSFLFEPSTKTDTAQSYVFRILWPQGGKINDKR